MAQFLRRSCQKMAAAGFPPSVEQIQCLWKAVTLAYDMSICISCVWVQSFPAHRGNTMSDSTVEPVLPGNKSHANKTGNLENKRKLEFYVMKLKRNLTK